MNKKTWRQPVEGFAHGFLVMSNVAVFNYKCTDYYAPDYDCGLLWNDEAFNVKASKMMI